MDLKDYPESPNYTKRDLLCIDEHRKNDELFGGFAESCYICRRIAKEAVWQQTK